MAKNKDTTYALPNWLSRPGKLEWLIVLVAFLLYANTIGHQFTQDDAIAIYDNMYVKEGIQGISKILTTDSFSGFFAGQDKSALVSGGRYRPFTMVLFACIYELVGEQPSFYHVLSIAMYALVCVLLYRVILLIGGMGKSNRHQYFTIVAAFIFLVHPIHTEVVANVKGLDETFSLIFSLLALQSSLLYVRSTRVIHLVLSMLTIFLAFLSKENSVAFLVLIPVVLFFFRTGDAIHRHKIIATTSLFAIFTLYLLLRISVVGMGIGEPPGEMMNNPFIKIENGVYVPFTAGEHWASVILCMGKYIQLLFFPHPLTHDYYPRHFGVVTFSDLSVVAAVIMNVALGLIALLGIKKRSFVSFCIFLFYVSIGLMANVIFPIGTHLSERFLFTPSISIALLVAYGLTILRGNKKYGKIVGSIFLLIMILGSIKTTSRNMAWYDDLTLFTTDVEVSKNSAKVRNAAGGALLSASHNQSDERIKNEMISDALVHLKEAVRIHPNYKEAHLLSGNGYSYLKDYDQSILSYDNALRINPYYHQAEENLLIVLREGARQAGSVQHDFQKAIRYLKRALDMSPRDFESTALMGTAYGSAGDHLKAIEYFEHAIDMKPDIATTYVNLGFAQLNAGLEEDAQISFGKAVQIDPGALDQIQKGN